MDITKPSKGTASYPREGRQGPGFMVIWELIAMTFGKSFGYPETPGSKPTCLKILLIQTLFFSWMMILNKKLMKEKKKKKKHHRTTVVLRPPNFLYWKTTEKSALCEGVMRQQSSSFMNQAQSSQPTTSLLATPKHHGHLLSISDQGVSQTPTSALSLVSSRVLLGWWTQPPQVNKRLSLNKPRGNVLDGIHLLSAFLPDFTIFSVLLIIFVRLWACDKSPWQFKRRNDLTCDFRCWGGGDHSHLELWARGETEHHDSKTEDLVSSQEEERDKRRWQDKSWKLKVSLPVTYFLQ